MRLEFPAEETGGTKVPTPPEKTKGFARLRGKPGRPSKPVGSRKVTLSGAVLIKQVDNTWAYEHRLVMEMVIGRKLNPDEEVRHLNGNHEDNRPENLYIFANGKLVCSSCGKKLT